MSDVNVTLGGDITPFKQAMAQVKLQAKETGESLGLEFDRGAARAELRTQRGMKEIVTSILTAKNPIDAVSGAMEGLGRAFNIAGGVFLAAGIGAAIYDQFSKASAAANKLRDGISKALSVNPTEPISQLKKDIEDFQKIEEQYQSRGLLTRILMGPQADLDFAKASNLNEVKKNLLELQQIADEDTKARARILEASDNPEDKRKGRALLKGISDKQETDTLKEQLQAAYQARVEVEKKLARANVLASKPVGSMTRGEMSEFNALAPQMDDLQKQVDEKSKIINALTQQESDLAKAQAAENAEDGKEKKSSKPRDDSERIGEAMKRQEDLKREAADQEMTDLQRIAALRKRISEEQRFTGPETRLQTLLRENKILEDQVKLEKLLNDQSKLKYDLFQKINEQGEAQSDLNSALAESQQFHGQVSSLQRIGGGGNIGGNQNHDQLKEVQKTNQKLDKIEAGIATLNAKIEGI